MANRIKNLHIQQIMDNEKIVTIHIYEYLELKSTIEELRMKIEILKKNQKKWYHLF